nr:arginine repressor C-terminal-like domain-containing protein [Tanacetum cinerariifolium]
MSLDPAFEHSSQSRVRSSQRKGEKIEEDNRSSRENEDNSDGGWTNVQIMVSKTKTPRYPNGDFPRGQFEGDVSTRMVNDTPDKCMEKVSVPSEIVPIKLQLLDKDKISGVRNMVKLLNLNVIGLQETKSKCIDASLVRRNSSNPGSVVRIRFRQERVKCSFSISEASTFKDFIAKSGLLDFRWVIVALLALIEKSLPGFDSLVNKSWSEGLYNGTPNIMLKKLKGDVKEWNYSKRVESSRLKEELKKRIFDWDQKAELGSLLPNDVDAREELLLELMHLEQNDRNSLKKRVSLFRKLEATEATFLEASISMDEIKDAVWSCSGSKSPGHDASISVLMNGSPSREFKMERGLRQGDPLSPFLFLIAVEALQVLTLDACNKGVYKGLSLAEDGAKVSLH